MRDRGFYWRWIGANCAGEALGLGTTFILGVLIAPALGADTSAAAVLAAAVTIESVLFRVRDRQGRAFGGWIGVDSSMHPLPASTGLSVRKEDPCD